MRIWFKRFSKFYNFVAARGAAVDYAAPPDFGLRHSFPSGAVNYYAAPPHFEQAHVKQRTSMLFHLAYFLCLLAIPIDFRAYLL